MDASRYGRSAAQGLVALALSCVVTGCGRQVLAGVGPAYATAATGGDKNGSAGLILALRAFTPAPGASGGLLAVDVQPIPVQNPNRDESVSTVTILPSLQLSVGRVGLRGGLGLGVAIWTGPDAFETFSYGPALGVSATIPLDSAGRWSLEPLYRTGGGNEYSSGFFAVAVTRRL